jgi:hypothetical protein
MKKGVLGILLVGLLLVSILSVSFVVAKKGENSGGATTGSNAGSSGDSDSTSSDESTSSSSSNEDDFNSEDDVEEEVESEASGGSVSRKTKTEITQTFINSDGEEVKVVVRVETKEKDGVVEEKFKVRMSNGQDKDLKVMPSSASQIAIEKFRSRNVSVVLKEVGEGNNLSVVYEAEANKTIKFLGLFKVKVELKAVIDSDTGEILRLEKPWWYFFGFGTGAVGCDADNLDLCETETECGDNDLIWFDEACVSGCLEDAFVCENNESVYRNESLSCEFNACSVVEVPEINETIVNETIINETIVNDTFVNETEGNQTFVNSSEA